MTISPPIVHLASSSSRSARTRSGVMLPDLARGLDADPAYLLRLTLEQQLGPVAARAITDLLGTPLTKNELTWIQELRNASDDLDPHITKKSRSALRSIFGR